MELRRSVLAWCTLIAVAPALTLAGGAAWAGMQVIDLTAEVTDEINFNTQKIRGQYVLDVNGEGQPFFVQVWADVGECLRLDVETQQEDFELVVVSPDGTVWRNDDRAGAADRRPLVKINGTPKMGFYTVQVSAFNGGLDTAEFRLKYGRFNVGSANCALPTASLTPTQAPEKAAKLGQ